MQRTGWTHAGWIALAALMMMACQPQASTQTVADKNYEVDYWEMHKGTCESVLSNPCGIAQEELLRCTKLWEMYRETTGLGIELRSLYAKGFSQLYHTTAPGYDQYIAMAALSRVGIRPHPMGPNECVVEEVPLDMNFSVDPFAANAGQTMAQAKADGNPNAIDPELELLMESRATVSTKKASKKKAKVAKKANSKGLKLHKDGKWGAAIKQYESALDAAPFYVYPKYNMACAYALLNDYEAAIMHLEEMYTWDDPLVTQQLNKARSDSDLVGVRDDMRFKIMTGYIRITLLNGAGEAGLPAIERIQGELGAKNFSVERVGDDKTPRLKPMIFYKPAFLNQAEDFKAMVGARDTQLLPINWETLDDVIIVWGEAAAAQLYGTDAGGAPIVQGERAEGGGGGSPLDALDKAEEVKGAAGDTADQATGLGEGLPGAD